MMAEEVVDRLIEDITDGIEIDWRRLEVADASVEDRKWLRVLRMLFDVGKVHRTVDASSDAPAAGAHDRATREAPSVDLPGWGKYTLEEKIGEGSFGNVYRAWDPELELHRAIKILHKDVTDARLRDRLLREGRALAKVSHDNVVKVIGIEAHENRVALCMEFVRGETLAQVVANKGPLSPTEAVQIGKALCSALLAVHRAGYLHRDIKAKNVMREAQTGRIVLMDFGTGRAVDRPEFEGDLAGTPMYMAPEVLEGDPASASSDVYSLGVLLYHLVTGEYPVEAPSFDELRDAHASRSHRVLGERRSDLPIPFMQVVERAIASDLDERYLDAAELRDALGALKIGDGVANRALRWGVAVAGAAALLPAIGLVTASHFNIMLERSGFGDDTFVSILRWGRMSIVAPTFMLLLTLLVVAPLVVARRIAVAASSSARRIDRNVRQRCASVAHRWRLDEVHVLASVALVVSAGFMIATWWKFFPLLTALFSRISTDDGDVLGLLSPRYVLYHNQYRVWFTYVVIVSVLVWIPVVRLVRRGQPLHRGMWLGGAVVTCVALAFLHFPYRLLYFNKTFEAVTWNQSDCYLIGERGGDVLLTCPDLAPPRNRIVARDDTRLVRRGITESVFTRFERKEISR